MGKSKISGGAYKYIQKFYGEQDMSYPDGMPGPGKLSEAQSTELDSNGDGELTGSDFESLGSTKDVKNKMGVKKYQPKKSGESYDMKEAYNKNLTEGARFNYLKNAIHDKNKN